MILTNTHLSSLYQDAGTLSNLSKSDRHGINDIFEKLKIQKMETEKIIKIYLEYQKHMILSRFTAQYQPNDFFLFTSTDFFPFPEFLLATFTCKSLPSPSFF